MNFSAKNPIREPAKFLQAPAPRWWPADELTRRPGSRIIHKIQQDAAIFLGRWNASASTGASSPKNREETNE